jgi:hypothetical protein
LEAVAEQQEVPKEEAAVETIGALVDWYGAWHLAVGCHQQLKRWTHGDGGSWQKLATARGHLIRHAIPAPHKGQGCQGPGMEFWDQACKNQTNFNLSVKKYKHNAQSHKSQGALLLKPY